MANFDFYFIIFTCLLHLCRSQNFQVEPKIVNGVRAKLDDTKHQVSIRLSAADKIVFGQGHICGGSLISNHTVLTAAHCLYDSNYKVRKPKELLVVGGTLDRYNKTKNTLSFKVKRFHYHKNYNHNTLENDIAVLILDGAVPENHPTMVPIQLNTNFTETGTMCQTTGWGALKEGGDPSRYLMSADLPVLKDSVCKKGYVGAFRNGMLCAGYTNGKSDACQGDSGGPFVCNKTLTGIVSWGNGCARRNFPGIYTNVSYFHRWIMANGAPSDLIGKRNLLFGVLLTLIYLFN